MVGGCQIKLPAGSRCIHNTTLDFENQSVPDLEVSGGPDLIQIEILRCQKGLLPQSRLTVDLNLFPRQSFS